jgi:SulP family sulfate permease
VAVAVVTLVTAAVIKNRWPRWPGLLAGLVAGSLLSLALGGGLRGIKLLGALHGTLPPLSSPDLTLDTLRLLAPGALAIALLGLIEALSIARSITVFSGQHIDGNQEFIGQGLSNIAGSFFSAYASSGSFTRSGVNYDSGARTPLAGLFAALFLVLIVMAVAPLTAFLPLSAMGGVILLVSVKLVDVRHIREIVRSSRADTLVLIATFAGTLLFQIEFAIYTGVLLSLAIYLTRTSHPHVDLMAPDPSDPRRRLAETEGSDLAECPQVTIVRINGSLFFGAVNHISESLSAMDAETVKRLLIVGQGINFVDVSGAMMLMAEARRRKSLGQDLYLCRMNREVLGFLENGGFIEELGPDHVFSTEYTAIAGVFRALDPAICQECTARIFQECRTVPYPEPGGDLTPDRR